MANQVQAYSYGEWAAAHVEEQQSLTAMIGFTVEQRLQLQVGLLRPTQPVTHSRLKATVQHSRLGIIVGQKQQLQWMGVVVLKGHPSKMVMNQPMIQFRDTLGSHGYKKKRCKKRTLSYSYKDEKSCINVCRGYVNPFYAMVLEKVNRESNGDEKFLVIWSFYPALHRLLTLRRN
ncbi:hypothetical protein Cgig2_027173 [Carnegiea gigantea]|uniref:Uncharacterized protein n=1 Tax=Carnegiea gigantea TaxID=171969 RepID=A0A9Q1KQV0_9CARY|nr:hypothetical protein Cgig2_027173 [Carnegiea gigantea]